ncbi:hypothetical protein [Metabacillus sp. KUDC1714]
MESKLDTLNHSIQMPPTQLQKG